MMVVRIGGLRYRAFSGKGGLMKLTKCIHATLFLAVSAGAFAQEPAPARRAPQPVSLLFREGWKDTAAVPVTQAVVTNSDLDLKVYGIGKDDATVNNEGGIP